MFDEGMSTLPMGCLPDGHGTDAVVGAAVGAAVGPIADDEVPAAALGLASAHLTAALDSLRSFGVPADAAALVELRAHLDALTALLAEAEVRFDSFELWREQGAGSMRGWLLDACGLSRSEATRVARRSERLELWPSVSEAWRVGALNGSQVDVIVSAVPARFVSMFSEHAPAVVSALSGLDVAGTEVAMRQWVRCAEAGDGPEQLVERASGLHVDRTLDGRVELSGSLTAAEGEILEAAIRDFWVPDAVDEHGVPLGPVRTQSQRTIDAVMSALSFAIAHREGAGDSGRFLPHVSLVIDVAELWAGALRGAGVSSAADLEAEAARRGWSAVERAWFADALTRHGDGLSFDGAVLDAATVGVLSCDSIVQRVVMAGSKVLDLGREVRTATAAQRRAIITRDRHCRAPGCRTRAKHCEVHHVDHWSRGGRTDVDRMVLLCGAHHRLFHRLDCHMELDEQARFTVHMPDGRCRSTVPERAEARVFARQAA